MEVYWEWSGCALGLLGAFVLALNNRWSQWGWAAFLASNVAWISYAVSMEAYGLLLQQLGFTITSLIGIRQWMFAKRSSAVSVIKG